MAATHAAQVELNVDGGHVRGLRTANDHPPWRAMELSAGQGTVDYNSDLRSTMHRVMRSAVNVGQHQRVVVNDQPPRRAIVAQLPSSMAPTTEDHHGIHLQTGTVRRLVAAVLAGASHRAVKATSRSPQGLMIDGADGGVHQEDVVVHLAVTRG